MKIEFLGIVIVAARSTRWYRETPPLGVLNDNSITFDPVLPAPHAVFQAIKCYLDEEYCTKDIAWYNSSAKKRTKRVIKYSLKPRDAYIRSWFKKLRASHQWGNARIRDARVRENCMRLRRILTLPTSECGLPVWCQIVSRMGIGCWWSEQGIRPGAGWGCNLQSFRCMLLTANQTRGCSVSSRSRTCQRVEHKTRLARSDRVEVYYPNHMISTCSWYSFTYVFNSQNRNHPTNFFCEKSAWKLAIFFFNPCIIRDVLKREPKISIQLVINMKPLNLRGIAHLSRSLNQRWIANSCGIFKISRKLHVTLLKMMKVTRRKKILWKYHGCC